MAGTVLIVCHANTARSVMAHMLLERMLVVRGVGDVRVCSGGVATWARDGMIPSLDARLALREEGIELAEDAMASTAIAHHPEVVASAHVIVTMTREQKAIMEGLSEAEGKPILTLRELAGESGDIADPAMQGEDVFRACRDEIKHCLEGSIDRLLSLLPGLTNMGGLATGPPSPIDLHGGPEMAPKPPTLVAPRQSRGAPRSTPTGS